MSREYDINNRETGNSSGNSEIGNSSGFDDVLSSFLEENAGSGFLAGENSGTAAPESINEYNPESGSFPVSEGYSTPGDDPETDRYAEDCAGTGTDQYTEVYGDAGEDPAAGYSAGDFGAGDNEFDPRFNLDRRADGSRRREYSYAGRRVSASQETDYAGNSSPEYEELRSSYGENEEYELDRQYGFTQEEKPSGKSKLRNLFKKKQKEGPYVSPVAENRDAVPDDPEDGSYDENEDGGMTGENDVNSEGSDSGGKADTKKRRNLFRGILKKTQETGNGYGYEEDDLSEDYDGAYKKEDDFIPASSFGEYIASGIAALFLRIRGDVPAEGSMGSAYAETEFMGEELPPLAASRYYGSQVFSLRFRTRLALGLTAVSLWLSLGAPSPGMLSNLRVATAACLAIELTVMLLALDVVTNAILNCFRKKFGADFLAVLSCLFSVVDALTVINATGVTVHMPLCSVSSLTLCGVLMSSLLSARGMRKSLRVPAIGKKKYAITTELNITGKEITVLKSGKPINGFLRRLEEAPLDEIVYGKLSLFIALFVLFLALIVAVAKRSLTRLIYIYSVILCTAVPCTALLCFALPFFMGSLKLFGNGAAIAGWSGVCELGHSHNIIVTDTDLFPEESVTMDNVRIFADYDAEKVVVYASSLILESGCGLMPVFRTLLEENGFQAVRVDNVEYLSGGGIKGMAEGHVLVLGCSDLMRLLNIRIPYRLVTPSSALLSIDGVLYGIFNISYKADPRIRKALVSLMRSSRNPVFAIRDFNVTPELIKEKFDVATDGYDFPPYADRYRISEAKPSGDSQVSGVLCREGLGPLTDLADTARKIYCVSRICVLISVLSSVIGAIYAFIHILASGNLPLASVLVFLLLFNLPVLFLGFITNMFE